MKLRLLVALGLGVATLTLVAISSPDRTGRAEAQRPDGPGAASAEAVRTATERYKSLDAAKAAGYGLLHGCVSGPQTGAMGVHYVNGALVEDGVLDPTRPEVLIYEYRNGQPDLIGVEYVVMAEAWHTRNEAPPVLMGQLFHYAGAPNRYGAPAHYELHVWAWKRNPSGTFADWNPAVSCDGYTATNERQGHAD